MTGPRTTCQTCGDDVDGMQHIQRTADENEPHCDFCNATTVNWTLITSSRVNADILVYDDKTLDTVASQIHNMSEDWAACDECHGLIDEGKWDEVAARAMASIVSLNDDMLNAVKELHEQVRVSALGWMKNKGGKIPGR